MVERGADGEVVESDVALVSFPAGAIGRSHASTLNLSAALKKAASFVKAQKSKNTSNKLMEDKLITSAIVQLINEMKEGSHNDMFARVICSLCVTWMHWMGRWRSVTIVIARRSAKSTSMNANVVRNAKQKRRQKGQRRRLFKRYLIMEKIPW
jgi:hypothetical protein